MVRKRSLKEERAKKGRLSSCLIPAPTSASQSGMRNRAIARPRAPGAPYGREEIDW
jgi:hypothetical protein